MGIKELIKKVVKPKKVIVKKEPLQEVCVNCENSGYSCSACGAER